MGERKNWYHAAGKVWPILVNAATNRLTITYEQLAPVAQTNPLSVGRALGPIQDYCLDNRLPPLTSIVVQKASGVPGGGFIAWDIDDLPSAHFAVFERDWAQVPNPYESFNVNDTLESLAEQLVTTPDVGAALYAKVRVRGVVQDIFRRALRRAYGSRCAICRFSFGDALDAAHIVPWEQATTSQRLDPKNGLLLCSLHHRLFDAGLITLTQSWKVAFRDQDLSSRAYSITDKQMTSDLHGISAHLPTTPDLRPSPIFLASHHQKHNFGHRP